MTGHNPSLGNKISNIICDLSKDFQPSALIDNLFSAIIKKRIDALDSRKNYSIVQSAVDDDGVRQPGFRTDKCNISTKIQSYIYQFLTIFTLTIINTAIGESLKNIPSKFRKAEADEERNDCTIECKDEDDE